MTDSPARPLLQPLLDDAAVTLHAPTQVWSAVDGDLGDAMIHGVYHGDVRHVRRLTLDCGAVVESTRAVPHGPSATVFSGILRGLDDDWADPRMRLSRERRVDAGTVEETWTISSALTTTMTTEVVLELETDFAELQGVKLGDPEPAAAALERTPDGAAATSGPRSMTLRVDGATVEVVDGRTVRARWAVEVPPRGVVRGTWTLELRDRELVIAGAPASDSPTPSDALVGAAAADERLRRWLHQAGDDLADLRLTTAARPDEVFYAAGAPWFFTLFGRDSIWAARLALAHDPSVAASTLRVLARLQGDRDDPATAEEPGKILHEVRASELVLPNEGVVLPPLYYGTVDATPLWVCLLADARRAGMPDDEVRDLLPNLERALAWIRGAGDGFLQYIDRTGTGLANQGWKDSSDSIQWRDGRLADGPIALCEVQGYAYEAALAGADLLEAHGRDAGDLRAWAAGLRTRFRDRFWVTTPEGRYPAVALDGHGAPVDSLTSNIGHLLGTGILDPEEERTIADLLTGPSMSSGYGLRTLSTGAAGYWPLSYHGGSVWTHDTAIVARGMARAGLDDAALVLVEGLLDAAAGFAYRMPELHSGDDATTTAAPLAYPAACRPQAWSAAAAFVCAEIVSRRG